MRASVDGVFLQRNVTNHLSVPVELHLNKVSQDMWDDVLRAFRDVLEDAEKAYSMKAKSKLTSIRNKAPIMLTLSRPRLQYGGEYFFIDGAPKMCLAYTPSED